MSLLLNVLNVAKFKLGGYEPICGPMKVQWELTYHCNLKCRHCHIWETPLSEIRENTLTFDEQKAILDDLSHNGVRHVSFSGGEMFLQKTVYDLITHAKSLGMKVGGNSNAFFINKDLAGRIATAGLDFLYISLDGHNSATHDFIRGVPGAFDNIFTSVANLRAAHPGLKIFFNTTINRHNVGQLTGIARLARDNGMDGMTVEMTNTFDKYAPEEDLTITRDQVALLKSQIRELTKNYAELLPHQSDYFDEFTTYLDDKDQLYKYRCVAGYTSAQIHPNGDLYACPVAFCKLGNLRERSFEDIWWSKEATRNRCDIKDGKHPICWITCISPLNQYLSYLSPLKAFKLLRPKTIAHILKKI